MLCLAFEQGAVGIIETAEDKGGAWLHDSHEVGHIGQKDVAIDVGEDEVELAVDGVENGTVATERCQVVIDVVDDGIMTGVVSTPLVDIVAYAGVGSQLESADAQDACSTSAIQDALALQVHIE